MTDYDPIESLREEVNRFHKTNAFNPLLVTLFYTQAKVVLAEVDRLRGEKAAERNGNWMDKWGACKVCDGELPHGHSTNCDIYKLECAVRDLTEKLKAYDLPRTTPRHNQRPGEREGRDRTDTTP